MLEGSSKRDLLKKIDATLLVFDDQLLHLESNHSTSLQNQEESLDPVSIAVASKSLLAEQPREHTVLLLLPPAEFLATTQTMPGVTKDNLVSALKLQADSILPAYEESVATAVNPVSAEFGDEHTALWISNSRMMEFFNAFEEQGIFLAAMKPRILNVHAQGGHETVIDYDEDSATAVKLADGVVRQWLHVSKLDLEQEEFAQQWQQSITDGDTQQAREFKDATSYLDESENSSNQEYSFFPQGALSEREKVEKGRKLLLAAGVVASLLFVSAIPFLLQSLEFRRLATVLEANRGMSVEARQDQAEVVNFENEWGPISDFPEQRVRVAMYTLQNVLSPDQLSSLEIAEGLIKLQGTSSEPQAILQRLEQDPMFTEVIFARATNNTRYYIDLRLSEVNFEAYMVRHFPDE